MHKQIIVVRRDLELSQGKLAGQVAHAAVSAYKGTRELDGSAARIWWAEGQTKIVVGVDDETALNDLARELEEARIHTYPIRDAGRTEIPEGTLTCFGVGPIAAERIDPYTRKLRLM